MDFYSTNSNECRANAKEAVLQGLASDGGLYMPAEIPCLPKQFFDNLEKLSFQEIAFEIAKSFFSSDINDTDLRGIIESALTFPAPVVNIHDNINTLELFHGPTLAFKDFGARFMARTMSHFLSEDEKQHLTILVATSGDTGSAVAQGFLDCPNIDVIILYPAGKVSKIQEMQLTTIGHNITALEVNGTFDDCQRLVKTAFADKNLTEKFLLGSVSQGQYVGGEWHAAPKSDNTDGLLDVCVAKTMTFLGLMTKLFNAYHDGKHIDNPKLAKKVIYRRSKEVLITAPNDIDLCVDGEMIRGNDFRCTIVPKAIKFVIPEE